MEHKVAENGVPKMEGDATRCQSVRVERLLAMIDVVNEEVEKSIDVIDDEGLQAVSSRFSRVQEALNSEQEARKRIPSETLEKLQQKELPDRVKLNVGGRVFAASLTALTSVKGTFFDSMFGGRWPLTPEADGIFGIVRNPNGFSMVLQFLHGHQIDCKTVSHSDMSAFIKDVDYYGLPVDSVEKWLGRRLNQAGEQWSSEAHSGSSSIIEENTMATRTEDSDYSWVLGANSYGEQDHVLITMRIEGGGRYTMVGVIEQQPDRSDSWRDPTSFGLDAFWRWRAGQNDGQSKVPVDTGDTIELELNCKQNKLTVRNTTQKKEDSMHVPAGKQWRLHVNLSDHGDSVRIIDSKWL